ncbi:hypothetical protein [Candidatus Magnetobacterium casense]|uniref:Uncharacterized protein n=1 Tax=Candidatus Magnetobacterium casense TaxID=1455061 RepID=A0ABS6RTL6_9BACT|nr:hypothetical protein [Candidatus Magnetobacterium casensis]MBV6339958.1 hypothetical protein [Candidatus Magnetobacterium casensis]
MEKLDNMPQMWYNSKIWYYYNYNNKMARSDLLLSLVKAFTSGDTVLFRKAVEALIAEERAKQHHFFADRLAESLNNASKNNIAISNDKVQNFYLKLPQVLAFQLLYYSLNFSNFALKNAGKTEIKASISA